MAKLRLTKTELKKRKDELAAFRRYLPTLNMKKKLLQKEHLKVEQELSLKEKKKEKAFTKARHWLALLGGDFDVLELIQTKKIEIEREYLAGIEIPKLKKIDLTQIEYDLYQTPFWVDEVLVFVQNYLEGEIKIILLHQKETLIKEELVVTSQRINLFEKVKIPEALGAIAKIRNHLDDEQTIAMGWALGAKKKLAKLAEGAA